MKRRALCSAALAFALCAAGCAGTTLHRIVTVPVEGGLQVQETSTWVYAEKETIETSPNVRTVTRMTDFQGERDAYFPEVSPDGRWVAFAIRQPDAPGREPVYNLWCVETRGGHALRQLTDSNALNLHPAWSPDSRFIYFASNRIGRVSHIWRISQSGGGGITQVTTSTTWDQEPSVSGKAGDQIAFSATDGRTAREEVWTVRSDGSFLTQIVRGMEPSVSPDGESIAFTVLDPASDEVHLWTMRADGSERTQLTYSEGHLEGVQDRSPSWSPDGDWLAFASDRGKDRSGRRNFDIWVVCSDGSRLTQLTTNGSYDMSPTWGPDGRYIYFQSNRGLSWDIWRLEADLPR